MTLQTLLRAAVWHKENIMDTGTSDDLLPPATTAVDNAPRVAMAATRGVGLRIDA